MAEAQLNSTDDPIVGKWGDRFRIAQGNQQPLFKRFSAYFDLFNASLSQDTAPWRSKVFLPILCGRAWALIAKLSAGEPGWQVKPRTYLAQEEEMQRIFHAARSNQIKLEYDYRSPYFDVPMQNKLAEVLIDAVVTGTGVAKIPWCVENQKSYSWEGDKQKVRQSRIGYNELIPHSVFRTFVAPSAKNVQSAPWIILQDWTTVSDLKKTNKAKGGNFYQNLERIGEIQHSSDVDSAKFEKSRNRLTASVDNISADDTIDSVEIWECYDNATGKLTWIADRLWVIREEENPYWHGRLPLVSFHIKPRPFSFWGQGIFEVNERMQIAANSIVNQTFDGLELANNGMLMHSANTELEDYVVQPGGEIVYQGAEPPTQMKFPDPNYNGTRTMLELIQEGINDNSISPYVSGLPNDANDKTQGTATGVKSLMESADDVLTFMRSNFLQSIHEIGRQWLVNNQQFMDRSVFVSITKAAGTDVFEVKPEEIQGEFDLTLDDKNMAPISKEQDLAQYSTWLQQILQLKQLAQQDIMQGIQTPPMVVKYQQLAQEVSDKYGELGLERFLGTPEESQAALEAMMQFAQSQSQQVDPSEKVLESVDYKDAPPTIQAQIEEKLGFEPAPDEERSQIHSHEMDVLSQQHQQTQLKQQDMSQASQSLQQAKQPQEVSQGGSPAEGPQNGSEAPQEGPQMGPGPDGVMGTPDDEPIDLHDPQLLERLGLIG